VSPEDGAGEAGLVEGRRPGPTEPVTFDEAKAEVGPGGSMVAQLSGCAIQRAATEDVRGCVTSSARGRKRRCRETQRGGAAIEAPPGPRGVLAVLAFGVSALEVYKGSRGNAEAGASPSSDRSTRGLAEASGGSGPPQAKGRKARRMGECGSWAVWRVLVL